MRESIDFGECLKDSPNFRSALEESEYDIEYLELKLEKLAKLCNNMVESGKMFNQQNGMFINGIHDLAKYFVQDKEVVSTLSRFAQAMEEMQRYNTILLDQAHRSICKNLSNFVKQDIKKVKETRKHFEKISDDTDNALIKNVQAPRNKVTECEEAHNVLTAMSSCFAHTSLDYVFQLNILHSKKRIEVLQSMLGYMHAQNAFFHQGYDLFVDQEQYMKTLATQLEELNGKFSSEKKEMEERHNLVNIGKRDSESSLSSSVPNDSKPSDIKMEGYLFKKTSKGFKSWVRRWFMIQNNQLVYRKRSKDNITVMEEDLRLCTVKPVYEGDRRFCFEVVSPARSHMLQADCDEECQDWMVAIQSGVSAAYDARRASKILPSEVELSSRTNSVSIEPASKPADVQAKSAKQSRVEFILSIAGNDVCCDCGQSQPRWASINLGITMCIECSGIHRSLGVHVSKVRSVTLDTWEPELLKVMSELGNSVVNGIYEVCNIDDSTVRATPECNRDVREGWIKAKYTEKKFVRKLPGLDERRSSRLINRRWSVCKRHRKSPKRQLKSVEDKDSKSRCTNEGEGHVGGGGGLIHGATLVQGESKDSGLSMDGSGSLPDVILFGANVNSESKINPELDSSETSSDESDPDQTSSTSLEEFEKLDPNWLLFKAAEAKNLPVMLQAMSQGADINWSNPDKIGSSPLIKAIGSGSLAASEFLMLNGAKVDRKDDSGKTALHHATILGHTGQVCQLLKKGANQHAVDSSGLDAIGIAMQDANADIVTLLRLAKLNEEMKETEGLYGIPGDNDTFTDVFRDFTNMASDNPEKLVRNQSLPNDSNS